MKKQFLKLPIIIFFIILFIFFYLLVIDRNPSNVPSALLNKSVPNFEAETLVKNKKFLSSKEFGSQVVLVNFFATWCKPCMKELPLLQNLYEKFDGKRVKWFLVDITEATRTSPGFEDSPKAGPFLAKKGMTMPILNDNRGVAKERYGAKTLPRLYVIDKFQTIRLAKKGFHEGEDFEGEVGSMVEILLAEADE